MCASAQELERIVSVVMTTVYSVGQEMGVEYKLGPCKTAAMLELCGAGSLAVERAMVERGVTIVQFAAHGGFRHVHTVRTYKHMGVKYELSSVQRAAIQDRKRRWLLLLNLSESGFLPIPLCLWL